MNMHPIVTQVVLVKMTAAAGVQKVEYLVSKRVTNNKCVITITNNTYQQPAVAKPYLLKKHTPWCKSRQSN